MTPPERKCYPIADGRTWPTPPQRTPDGRAAPQGGGGQRILIIQNDQQEADTFANAIGSLRLECAWASTAGEGLAAARLSRFDLFFVDLDLPDMSGIATIKALRAEDVQARLILVVRSVTASISRDALRVGALGVLGRPLQSSDVIMAVRAALSRNNPPGEAARGKPGPVWRGDGTLKTAAGAPRSIAERWAMLMVSTIRVEGDPKTMSTWARSLGVSRSVLCECCRLVHVPPHNARDFARFMRAIWRSGPRWEPESLLDLADARTLRKLLAQAGLSDTTRRPPTMLEFLDAQHWIPRGNPGLAALRGLLFNDDGRSQEPAEEQYERA